MKEVLEALFHLPGAFWDCLRLTVLLAFTTAVVHAVFGIPFAWWLNETKLPFAPLIESLVTLPIVLPPTVLGFYLLVFFSPKTAIGSFWVQLTGDTLAFSFTGLVIGSVIYSLPFAVQPMQAALKSVPRESIEAALAAGATPIRAFFRVTLPLASRGVLAGLTLSFAHTMGEFGVVLMLGGSIPGKTRVASIALYDEVQKLNDAQAHAIALVLLVVALALVGLLVLLKDRTPLR